MPKISILFFLLELNISLSTSTYLGTFQDLSFLSFNIINTNINLLEEFNSGYLFKNVLLVCSFLSLIIGSIVGLAQNRIKRLLAFSTISHIGFILLALSINTEQSIESFIFYIIQYSITNLNAFLVLLAFSYVIHSKIISLINTSDLSHKTKLYKTTNDLIYISELKEQFIKNPLLALSFSLSLFSMAGIPPLIGFIAKQQILYAAIQNGYYFMSIIAILTSVISAFYYLNIIKVLIKSELTPINTKNSNINSILDKNDYKKIEANSLKDPLKNDTLFSSNSQSFLISTLTLFILLFLFKPSLILDSIHLMALSKFYF
jgi:NADH-ubiquinone oxidoreductase chain 2